MSPAVYWLPFFGSVLRNRVTGETVMIVGRDTTGREPSCVAVLLVNPSGGAQPFSPKIGDIMPGFPYLVAAWDVIED